MTTKVYAHEFATQFIGSGAEVSAFLHREMEHCQLFSLILSC